MIPQDRGGSPALPNFNFAICYWSGKSNVDTDALSWIQWDQNIKAEAVETIFKAHVEGPDAVIEVYACHEKAISSLILESPPTQVNVTDWVQAEKVDPAINQVITWLDDKRLDTVKVGEEMSQELKQYLRQKGQLHLHWEVLY